MKPEWFCQLYKAADLVIDAPVGVDCWSVCMHKPLITSKVCDRYVVIALLGKIKGESGERAHLIPCLPVTSSGIDAKASVGRLMMFKAT
jgi:hypothetical protein